MRLAPIVAIAMAIVPITSCEREPNLPLGDVAGCYALTFGRWSWPERSTPPDRISLDMTKPQGNLISWSVNPHVVRPNIPQMSDKGPPAIWFVDTANALHMVWTTGFHGYGLVLWRQQDSLAGEMTAFSDYRGLKITPRASVNAHRIQCDSAQSTSAASSSAAVARAPFP